jgi:hypothetical protein
MSIFYFLAFFYVVVIAIILLADDLPTTIAIMALVANILTIAICFNKMGKQYTAANSDPTAPSDTATPPDAQTSSSGLQEAIDAAEEVDQDPNLYGDDWEAHHAYNSTFDTLSDNHVAVNSPAELSTDYDSTNALLSRQRFQGKKAIDGALVKTADYYKYQYADELAQSEAKPWWGNTEF